MRTVECISPVVTGNFEPDLALSCFDPLPQIVVDNPQMRNLDDLPFAARVRPSHPLPGARILDVAAPVPFEAPGIGRVVQKAGSAIGLAADRRVAPWPSVGAGDAVLVQPLGDRPGAVAIGE